MSRTSQDLSGVPMGACFSLGASAPAPVSGALSGLTNRCSTMQQDRPRDEGYERRKSHPRTEMRPV